MKNLENVYDDRYKGDYRETLGSFEIARWKAIKHFVTKILKPTEHLKVLDYGSGSGLHINLWKKIFPTSELFFCDISKVALEKLTNRYPEYESNVAGFRNNKAQFEDHMFDIIVSIEVMEHVEDLDAYLHDIQRLLRPSGIFIWTTPCGNQFSIEHMYSVFTNQIEKTSEGYRRWKWEDPTHVRRLKSSEIKPILLKHGFKNVGFRFRSHFFSFVCSRLCRGPLRKVGERLMSLDYLLFRKLPNGASMIGFAKT